jgi:hypothetical protein
LQNGAKILIAAEPSRVISKVAQFGYALLISFCARLQLAASVRHPEAECA